MTRRRRFFASQDRPVAAVYRGPAASRGCAESLADLLRTSPDRYKVHYLGPNEDHDVSKALLSHLDLFAWPGGGDDEEEDFKLVVQYTEAIQDFVRHGGKFLGVCLGAFFVRGERNPFFGLLPPGSFVAGERFSSNAEVRGTEDTIIQVDWTWQNDSIGREKGSTTTRQWMYFQDGALVRLTDEIAARSRIVARYTSTQDVCAAITPYGRGFVGMIGTHPEADKSWYEDEGLQNPQGISFSFGYDLIRALSASQSHTFGQ